MAGQNTTPGSVANREIILPEKFGQYLWGWPEQFAARAQQNDSRVFLYQTRDPYNMGSDLRDKGIGLFTGDLYGVAEKAKN